MEDALLENLFTDKERLKRAINTCLVDKHFSQDDARAFCDEYFLIGKYLLIKSDTYCISAPCQKKVKKDNGEFRIVYVNQPFDRFLLSLICELLFDYVPELVHERCKSYQKNLGTGKTVKEVSKVITSIRRFDFGVKTDLSKYFDSVPIGVIDGLFDRIESILRRKGLLGDGHSKVINVLRRYYHQDTCYTPEGELITLYQSLKQGCAVASYLANACLYDIDEEISHMDVYYVRYSDDVLILGNNWKPAFVQFGKRLNEIGLTLNPKKVEKLYKNTYFKFLGYSLRNDDITLSANRVRKPKGSDKNGIQEEIIRIVKRCQEKGTSALKPILHYLYVGDGQYSWATSVLPIINVTEDIETLDNYIKDCIRATMCGIKIRNFGNELGGLGIELKKPKKRGIISRGKGTRVKTIRERTPEEIDGYYSLKCMRDNLIYNREVYRAIISTF